MRRDLNPLECAFERLSNQICSIFIRLLLFIHHLYANQLLFIYHSSCICKLLTISAVLLHSIPFFLLSTKYPSWPRSTSAKPLHHSKMAGRPWDLPSYTCPRTYLRYETEPFPPLHLAASSSDSPFSIQFLEIKVHEQ